MVPAHVVVVALGGRSRATQGKARSEAPAVNTRVAKTQPSGCILSTCQVIAGVAAGARRYRAGGVARFFGPLPLGKSRRVAGIRGGKGAKTGRPWPSVRDPVKSANAAQGPLASGFPAQSPSRRTDRLGATFFAERFCKINGVAQRPVPQGFRRVFPMSRIHVTYAVPGNHHWRRALLMEAV